MQVRPDPRIFAKPSLHESASGPRIQSASGPELRNRRPPRSAGIRIRLPGKKQSKKLHSPQGPEFRIRIAAPQGFAPGSRGKTKQKNCTVRRDRNLGSASPPRRDPHRPPGKNKAKNCKVRSSYKLGSASPPPGSASPPGEKQSKKLQSPQQLQIRIRIAPRRDSHQAPGKNKQKNCKVRSSYKLGSAWPRRVCVHNSFTQSPAPLRSAFKRPLAGLASNNQPRPCGASHVLPWNDMEPYGL